MAPSSRKVDPVPAANHGQSFTTSCSQESAPAVRRGKGAVICLGEAIAASGLTRPAIAGSAGVSEFTLSKILTANHGIPGTLLDSLPDRVLADFMKRLGRSRGIEVRLMETCEISEQVRETLGELQRAVELLSARSAEER